jgi:hypothetical protein
LLRRGRSREEVAIEGGCHRRRGAASQGKKGVAAKRRGGKEKRCGHLGFFVGEGNDASDDF